METASSSSLSTPLLVGDVDSVVQIGTSLLGEGEVAQGAQTLAEAESAAVQTCPVASTVSSTSAQSVQAAPLPPSTSAQSLPEAVQAANLPPVETVSSQAVPQTFSMPEAGGQTGENLQADILAYVRQSAASSAEAASAAREALQAVADQAAQNQAQIQGGAQPVFLVENPQAQRVFGDQGGPETGSVVSWDLYINGSPFFLRGFNRKIKLLLGSTAF